MTDFLDSSVPRDPDDAVDFIMSYILSNEERYFNNNNQIYSKYKLELIDLINILYVASKRSTITELVKKNIGEIWKRSEEDSIDRDLISGYLRENSILLTKIRRRKEIENHFDMKGDSPVFALDSSESQRISDLCNEMREIIGASSQFSDPHKIRLLGRISDIETEILKDKGRFDVILGGVVEFGDALGKFGKNVKPLVDRMAEIRKITQSKSKAYEGLPAPEEVKKLPPPEPDEDAEE